MFVVPGKFGVFFFFCKMPMAFRIFACLPLSVSACCSLWVRISVVKICPVILAILFWTWCPIYQAMFWVCGVVSVISIYFCGFVYVFLWDFKHVGPNVGIVRMFLGHRVPFIVVVPIAFCWFRVFLSFLFLFKYILLSFCAVSNLCFVKSVDASCGIFQHSVCVLYQFFNGFDCVLKLDIVFVVRFLFQSTFYFVFDVPRFSQKLVKIILVENWWIVSWVQSFCWYFLHYIYLKSIHHVFRPAIFGDVARFATAITF